VYPNRPCDQGIGGVDSAAVPCPFRLVLSGAAGRLTVSDQELEPVEKGCRSAPLPLTKAPFDLGEVHARVLDPSQDLDDVARVNEEVLSVDLLPDWTEDWVLMERERYHQLRLRALEALCRRLTLKGRCGQAV
jgi:hypothetical protein